MVHQTMTPCHQLSGGYAIIISNNIIFSQHEADKLSSLQQQLPPTVLNNQYCWLLRWLEPQQNGMQECTVLNSSSHCLCAHLCYQSVATVVPSEPERKQGMLLHWFHTGQSRLVSTVSVSLDCWMVALHYVTAHSFECAHTHIHRHRSVCVVLQPVGSTSEWLQNCILKF